MEEFLFRLTCIVVVLLVIQHSLNMVPVLKRAHLIEERTGFALLQLFLHFGGDILQRGKLVQTRKMNLTVCMRSAVLLMLIADF